MPIFLGESEVSNVIANSKRVVILGKKGQAKEIFEVLVVCGVEESSIIFMESSEEKLLRAKDFAFLGLGSPELRANCFERHRNFLTFPTLVHPRASVGSKVVIGNGSLIQAGVVITTDVKIGQGCLINSNVTIGHDVIIDDFVVINPGAIISGNVTICNKTLVGANSTVLQNIAIGSAVCVGAGAVVTKNVLEGETVIGIPARPMKD